MNYIKTIFITIILLHIHTLFNKQEYVAYTTEQQIIPVQDILSSSQEELAEK